MNRTPLGILTLLAWAWAAAASAQVELTWSLAHHRTVLMEPVRATVTIANRTGQTLDLSARGNARLSFDVISQAGLKEILGMQRTHGLTGVLRLLKRIVAETAAS